MLENRRSRFQRDWSIGVVGAKREKHLILFFDPCCFESRKPSYRDVKRFHTGWAL